MAFDYFKDLEVRIRNLAIEIKLKQDLLQNLKNELRWREYLSDEDREKANEERIARCFSRPVKSEFLAATDTNGESYEESKKS